MKNKKIMIPVLVVAFLLAGAGTVFALAQIKSANGEQHNDDTAVSDEKTENPEGDEAGKEGEAESEKEEEAAKKTTTAEDENKKLVERVRACAKLEEEKNVELRKEDRKYSDSLQKVSYDGACEGEGCLSRESVDKTHADSVSKINAAYAEKAKKAGCQN